MAAAPWSQSALPNADVNGWENPTSEYCCFAGCLAGSSCVGPTDGNTVTAAVAAATPNACIMALSSGASTHKPADFGCTAWESCTFELVEAMENGNCYKGKLSVPAGCWQMQAGLDITCQQTGWDEHNRQACCLGQIDSLSVATMCDPIWTPADPFGSCTAYFAEACVGSSSCGRHKFLTPSATSDQDGAPCNAWYLQQRDNSANGWYTKYGLSDIPQQSITAEITRYCAEEGGPSGECGCWNAVVACSGTDCLFGFPTGSGRRVEHRLDVYCADSCTEAGCSALGADACPQNPGYGAPTLNGGSANPYAPPPGGVTLPLHCWLPACQASSDECIFKSLPDLLTPCPSVCLQVSSSAPVVIDGVDVPFIEINDYTLQCAWEGYQQVPPFDFGDYAGAAMQAPIGAVYTLTLPLTCTAQDAAPGFSATAFAPFSTLAPLVEVVGAPTLLPNNSVTTLTLVVDTGGLQAYDGFNGMILATDPTGANPPSVLPFTLETLQATDPPNFALPFSMTSTPPSVSAVAHGAPRTLPPEAAAAAAAISAKYKGEHGRVSRQQTRKSTSSRSHKASSSHAWLWWLAAAVLLALVVSASVWAVLTRQPSAATVTRSTRTNGSSR